MTLAMLAIPSHLRCSLRTPIRIKMCAVMLIPPGRNYKLLPALAKNVPPARFLNASRPHEKRSVHQDSAAFSPLSRSALIFNYRKQIAERILLMVRSRGDCRIASHNATCYASLQPTYAPATRGRGATAVSLRVLVNIYFYVCHFNATGHLSSYKFTFL